MLLFFNAILSCVFQLVIIIIIILFVWRWRKTSVLGREIIILLIECVIRKETGEYRKFLLWAKLGKYGDGGTSFTV